MGGGGGGGFKGDAALWQKTLIFSIKKLWEELSIIPINAHFTL